jgi:hypothetical protein
MLVGTKGHKLKEILARTGHHRSGAVRKSAHFQSYIFILTLLPGNTAQVVVVAPKLSLAIGAGPSTPSPAA